MVRRKTQPTEETVTYPAVADTDEAVAAKLRTMVRETSNPDLANAWSSIADAAESGRLSPSIRREFARCTQFSK